MVRLRHFEDFRFVGARDTMVVYDTDNDDEAAEIAGRIEEDDLFDRVLLQTFAPDTLPEARNRGFKPVG